MPSPCSAFILTGGAAEQAGTIEAGDEILAINGKPLVGLMHFDAWNIMKSVPEGPVQLVIRKHRNSSWNHHQWWCSLVMLVTFLNKHLLFSVPLLEQIRVTSSNAGFLKQHRNTDTGKDYRNLHVLTFTWSWPLVRAAAVERTPGSLWPGPPRLGGILSFQCLSPPFHIYWWGYETWRALHSNHLPRPSHPSCLLSHCTQSWQWGR